METDKQVDSKARQRPPPAPTASDAGRFLESQDAFFWEAMPLTFNCTFASAQIERMFGYTAEEWREPGMWSKCIHPDDRERILQDGFLSNQTSNFYVLEYRLITKAGTPLWVRDAVTVESQDGRPWIVRGITTDITHRKRMEGLLSAQSSVGCILAMSPDIDAAAPQVLETLTRTLGWDAAECWLVENPGDPMRHLASWPRDQNMLPGPEDLPRRLRRALFEHVRQTGESLGIPDLSQEARCLPDGADSGPFTGSAFYFPILLGRRVLGIIGLFCAQVQSWDSSVIPHLETLGRSLGQFHERQCAEERVRASEERHRSAEQFARLGT